MLAALTGHLILDPRHRVNDRLARPATGLQAARGQLHHQQAQLLLRAHPLPQAGRRDLLVRRLVAAAAQSILDIGHRR